MKSIRSLLSALLLTGTVGLAAQSVEAQTMPLIAQGVLSASILAPGVNYCELKFPAITQESLFSDHPVLSSPGTGDIIDFYGPCDENPVGKDQVWHQKLDFEHDLENGSD